MGNSYLLARDGQAYIVSGFALETAPYVRTLAYRVDADVADATGVPVYVEWAYTGPRRATYRTSGGFRATVVYDPSKTADLILDFQLSPPKCRKPVRYESGTFVADYANGPRVLTRYEGDHLAGYIAGAFPTRKSDTLPPEKPR